MYGVIGRLASAILSARYPVVLTGAGISTESGIPDFRGQHGLWVNKEVTDILSLETLYGKPELFYSKGMKLLKLFQGKEPNPAHKALALLEKISVVKTIITQNIDGLHQAAGSENVLEIHGNLRTCSCDKCKAVFPFQFIENSVAEDIVPPRCLQCGGIVRPDVVFFDDPMPGEFNKAIEEVQRSDFLLVVGSSLQVAPAAYLPGMVPRLCIINLEPTPYDDKATVVIHEKAGKVLSNLARLIEGTVS